MDIVVDSAGGSSKECSLTQMYPLFLDVSCTCLVILIDHRRNKVQAS